VKNKCLLRSRLFFPALIIPYLLDPVYKIILKNALFPITGKRAF